MSNPSHFETPEFPLESSGDAEGPSHRQAHEIGCGALVIRATEDGHAVCLKLDRIGKDYIHHYVLVLDPHPTSALELLYIDPEEKLFDCFATLDLELGPAQNIAPDVGHVFENQAGHFIKALDDPKSQKMFGFVDTETGLVCLRQERKIARVHPDWKARAKFKDSVLELADLLKHFAGNL